MTSAPYFYPSRNFFNEHGVVRTHSYPVKLKIQIYHDLEEDKYWLLQVMTFRQQKFILTKHEISERQATRSDELDEAVQNVIQFNDPDGDPELRQADAWDEFIDATREGIPDGTWDY